MQFTSHPYGDVFLFNEFLVGDLEMTQRLQEGHAGKIFTLNFLPPP